ncbi:hypothetical protein ABVY47_004406 [Vibrio parahaemolyticus]|nr:hypothetical protein [Vibrio parahaemolyticus]EJC6850645.1 hypothetical protein [Vibrio parahaemolyticus]EJC7138100.1 hypothetical protein [Vibrio parahaemolyticus]EKG9570649.1 hypothetical protein [Vibrio parahaemolyticus]EKG9575399.1 hypothetical protein [Vibrio parahaemolyticus]
MSKLLEELLKRGFKAKMCNKNIFVNLSLFSFPVSITHNAELNTYELKMEYWRYIVVMVGLSINVVIGFVYGNIALSFFILAIVLCQPIGLYIAKSRAKALAEYLSSVNGEART